MLKSEKFTSVKDDLAILIKGNVVGKFSLYYHTENDEKIALYVNILNGKFKIDYRFDPVSLSIYKNAKYYTMQVVGDGEITTWQIYEPKKSASNNYRYNALNNNGAVTVTTLRGEDITVPILPEKVVFFGNSLLLGMSMKYGMCSTSPENDYAYFVTNAIKEKAPYCEFEKISASPFELATTTEEFDNWFFTLNNQATNKPVTHSLTLNVGLILVQVMDNVNTPEKVEAFKLNAENFIKQLKLYCPSARIVWVYGWYFKEDVEPIIISICKKYKIEVVNISNLHTVENEATSGQISVDENNNPIVVNDAWITHPGNKGMKLIADAIIKTLFN